jgi:probable HAF family extracellular repeat protein
MRRTVNALLIALAVGWVGASQPTETGSQHDRHLLLSYTRYTVTDVGTLGGAMSEAWGINNAGQVVGRSYLAGNAYYHAFLFENGRLTDLGTIGQGCNPGHSWAFDINDAGQITGESCTPGVALPRAFLRTGGTMVSLGTLGGTGSSGRGINSAGHVVGTAAMPGDPFNHPFLYDGTMHDLGSLGGAWGGAYQINDNGRVVGYSEIRPLPDRNSHAFLYSAATMTDLFPATGCCSAGWGINNADKVVGNLDTRAFLYSAGTVTDLGTLAGSLTSASGINNHDQIVGYSAVGAGLFHAFLWEEGTLVDLNTLIPDNPEWVLNFATAINDVGQIAGIGTIGGQTHGFLLTPVPTPPTAVDDAYTTGFQAPLSVPAPGVLANDYGSGMSSMAAGLVASVTHGTLVLNPDGGFTYTPAAGYSGSDTFTYRAINTVGLSNLATVSLTVTQATVVQPPTALYAQSIANDVVTLRWLPPLAGPRPTGYTVEGGLNPNEVLAILPTNSSYPIHTFAAPAGSFYVRVHAVIGPQKSAASNEIRIHVRVPTPPSAPASLTAVVNGSNVRLTWRNTFGGGSPTGVFLQAQAGSSLWTFPLGLSETFAANGVADGIYRLRLSAANAGGASGPSNEVVVTVPGACSGAPAPPSAFIAYRIGRTVFVLWDPPTSGPAATIYEVIVAGAFVGRFPTTGRTLSGAVAPGSYQLSVLARNDCGSSAATPAQTVMVD